MTLPACDRIIELSLRSDGGRFDQAWHRLNETAALAPKIALALNEAARMIEEAEHATSCPWMPPLWRNELKDCADMYNCTCWKRTALARINELLTNP